MPIEIKELVIKVNVNEGGGKSPSDKAQSGKLSDNKAIVAECMEQIMDVFKKNKER